MKTKAYFSLPLTKRMPNLRLAARKRHPPKKFNIFAELVKEPLSIITGIMFGNKMEAVPIITDTTSTAIGK
ncbi:MAG: hypothetical protein KAI75_03290 [Desulfobulbaceae bacterium]|nr:hypothetical protein [Desulfobulbaceae bacterium]